MRNQNQKPTFLMEEADIFKGVTNDESYAEAEVKKELRGEKAELEKQKAEIEKKLKDFDEKIKREKAKKLFVPKHDFLMREQLERLETFVKKVDKLLKEGDRFGLERALCCEIWHIQNMNNYLANDNVNPTDILYDYGVHGVSIYKKIKDNNADFNRTNKELRTTEIRETNWIQFSDKESGDKPCTD